MFCLGSGKLTANDTFSSTATFCFHNRWNNTPTAYLRNSYRSRSRKETYVRVPPPPRRKSQFFQCNNASSAKESGRLPQSLLLFSIFFFSPCLSNDRHGMINDGIMLQRTKVNPQQKATAEKHAGCTEDGQRLYPRFPSRQLCQNYEFRLYSYIRGGRFFICYYRYLKKDMSYC